MTILFLLIFLIFNILSSMILTMMSFSCGPKQIKKISSKFLSMKSLDSLAVSIMVLIGMFMMFLILQICVMLLWVWCYDWVYHKFTTWWMPEGTTVLFGVCSLLLNTSCGTFWGFLVFYLFKILIMKLGF